MTAKIKVVMLMVLLLLSVYTLLSAEKIKAIMIPNNPKVKPGDIIEMPIVLDLEGFPERLGSYTATLTWDTTRLQFAGFTGGNTDGFEQPVVNKSKTAQGKLTFAHASPYGATGLVNILNVKFNVVNEAGLVSDLELTFEAMAAANTFNDLLPYLDNEAGIKQPQDGVAIPNTFRLEQNYPNPFNAGTTIKFEFPNAGLVELIVYNLMGEVVRTLVNEKRPAGHYLVHWDGKDNNNEVVSTGIYYYKLKGEAFQTTRKMLLIK